MKTFNDFMTEAKPGQVYAIDALADIIKYCQLEITKAKKEYKENKMTLPELQRLAKSLNNVISFVQLQLGNKQ